MKRYLILHLIGATATLLNGCDVKDPIFNTSHPGHGMVTLTTDWSGIGDGLTVPESYMVTVGDAYTASLTGITNKLDALFNPGNYRLYVYNRAEHVTLDGGIATVAETSDNREDVGEFVRAVPGWLFTSAMDIVITADTEYALTAVMQQQVRQLTLIISPTGGSTDRIERIEGYLSGAASTLDIADGTHGAPVNVELEFSRITSGTDTGGWSATVRLLGIAGTQQKLNARIYFSDGSPAPVTLNSDLTAELVAFNTDKRTPLVLGGKVVETPAGEGFTATITDWIPVQGGTVVAN